MTETEQTFEDLLVAMTKPRIYGKKYLSAETSDDLLLVLGESFCVAAFSIVHIFGLPRRGRLILKLIKALSKQSNDRHHYLYNFTFSHCLIYITRKTQQAIEKKIGLQAEGVAEKAYANGGLYYAFLCSYTQEDKDALFYEMELRFSDYPDGKVIDEKILLQNIIDGIEQDSP